MKDNYIQEGKYSFLRIEADKDADDGFEVRMITNNQPETLLKMVVSREGGQTFFDYNVTGLSSLASVEDEASTYLFSVVSGLEKLGEILPEYLLSADALSLEAEHVFVRKETGQVYFCYLPGKQEPFQVSLRTLMEFFMKYSAPSDPEEVLLLYGLYQKSREENVQPGSLAEFWREKKNARSEKKDLPVIEEPEVAFPDEEIYAELGLEKPKKPVRTLLQESEKPPVRTEIPVRAAEKEKKLPFQWPWKKEKEAEPSEESKEAPKTLSEKLKNLWKHHKGEIAVAAVVVVGAVLILLR